MKIFRQFKLDLFLALGALLLSSSMFGADGEIKLEAARIKAEDGGISHGLYYTPAGKNPRTAVLILHPEGDGRMDWRCEAFAQAGIGAYGMAGRFANDDAHLIMEELMLDIAATIRWLRGKGVENVVLHGHSGGGSTFGYYLSQAFKEPPHRYSSTPAGDPPDLNKYDLSKADGLIISAAHWGRGWAVLRKIDPSVTDESDPLSVDPTLDMYNPANGFRTPPEPSHFSKEFLERVQRGKEARMQRLIETARKMVREKKFYQQYMKSTEYQQLPEYDRIRIERAAIVERYLLIYRKWAVPKYLDLRIDPSDRTVGASSEDRPELANYSKFWHPTYITPEAFLSSESTASQVRLLEDLKNVRVPTLVICGSADRSASPGENQAILDASSAKDKELVYIEGANHGYLPDGPKAGKRDQRQRTAQALINWVKKRFPV